MEHGSIFGKGILDCGLISKKSEEFLAKYPERDSGPRVDFRKVEGFFRKMTAARPIWTVYAADRTATKSRRRGTLGGRLLFTLSCL